MLEGGRDGRVPVLTLPQRGFDVGTARRWRVQQNRLVETALSRGAAEPGSGSGTPRD